MVQDDQSSKVQLPVGPAELACFACFAFLFWATRSSMAVLNFWWANLLVYSLLPVATAFVILHRSNWHQERAGTARTGSLLLLSCLIFSTDLVVIGILVSVLCIFVGINRGHQ